MTPDEIKFHRDMTRPEVQRQLRRQAISYERRQDNTLKERIRRCRTRSIDVPNSREARIVIADNRPQAVIRACRSKMFRDIFMPILNDKPRADWNFYSTRMKWAIEYIRERRKLKCDSDEYREMAAFLWMVWKNWRGGKAKETISALGIDPHTYQMRIWRLTQDFASPDWEAFCVVRALQQCVNQRAEEEKRDNGGILRVCFMPNVPDFGGTG